MNALWFDRIEKALLLILSSFVLLPHAFSSIALVLLLALALIRRSKTWLPRGNEWMHFWLPILLLLMWVLSAFAKDGGREMQLWPTWIAAFLYFRNTPFRSWFKDCFKWVSLAQSVVFFGFVAYISQSLPKAGYSYFLRESISEHLHVHPTFLTMAWTWAALLFFLHGIQKKQWLEVLAAIVMTIAAAFAGGKMPFVAAAVVLIIWGWKEIESRAKRMAILLSVAVLIFGNLAFNPVINERIHEFKNISLDFEHDDFVSSTELRIGIWSCALETATEHWFSGVGLGHTRAALDGCFVQYNHPVFFDGEYNEHNQFLHVWLAGGLLFFIAFLAYWVWLKWHLLLNKQWLAYYFLIYFLLNILTENYLNRQFGMMMGAFMLFGLMDWKKQD